jgi:hypothetical protein
MIVVITLTANTYFFLFGSANRSQPRERRKNAAHGASRGWRLVVTHSPDARPPWNFWNCAVETANPVQLPRSSTIRAIILSLGRCSDRRRIVSINVLSARTTVFERVKFE